MAKKKILLIQPPVEDYYSTPSRTYPLGLLYLAAGPKAAGHEVVLLDAMSCHKSSVMPAPSKFKYLEEFYKPGDKSPYRLFGHFRHFGMRWEEISARIRLEQPDIIGISSLFTPYHSQALRIAHLAKTILPGTPVVMGGHHISVRQATSPDVDHFIQGEGEVPFMEYLGQPLPEGPLLPARELIDPDAYTFNRKRMTFLLTSRGCPHACAFCSVHAVFRKFRQRPVSEILEEMEVCIRKFGIRHFDIEDDSFGYDRDHALAVLNGIIRMNQPELTLSLMNGICADVLDEEMLLLMRRAGFKTLNLSVISADPGTCARMRRPFDPGAFKIKVMMAAALGFDIIAYCIIGLPGETVLDMIKTLKFLNDLPVTIGPSLFYPVPGTSIYKECLEKRLLKNEDEEFFRLTAVSVETPDFKRKDIMTLFYLGRILNLVKGLRAGTVPPVCGGPVNDFLKSRKLHHYFKNGKVEAAFSEKTVELFFDELQPVF